MLQEEERRRTLHEEGYLAYVASQVGVASNPAKKTKVV
jgi:hypothetical protein